jgi:Fe-S cluster biogenesis protein NfuA
MSDASLIARIKQVLEQIRPTIIADGGDIEFVRFENGVVYVRLKGACVTCPASVYTLKLGLEEGLKEALPEVTEVVAVEEE